VKLTGVLFHGPKSNKFIDLIRVEDQCPRLDRTRRALSKLWRLGLAITMNRRYVNKD
jgi:hypothetical protein